MYDVLKENMKIENYFDINGISRLFNTISSNIGNIWLSLQDDDEIYIDMNVHDICKRFHRVNMETSKLCAVCNKNYKKEYTYLLKSNIELNYIEWHCGNDIFNVIMPIHKELNYTINFCIGQFFIKDEVMPNIDLFKQKAKQFTFNEDEYINSYISLPMFTRSQINNFLINTKQEILKYKL